LNLLLIITILRFVWCVSAKPRYLMRCAGSVIVRAASVSATGSC